AHHRRQGDDGDGAQVPGGGAVKHGTALRLAMALLVTLGTAETASAQLWQQVEVIRTAHGVPHIRAENLRAAGYALAWMQLEDYGPGTALNLLRSSGRMA